jgi:hypothetical protein
MFYVASFGGVATLSIGFPRRVQWKIEAHIANHGAFVTT